MRTPRALLLLFGAGAFVGGSIGLVVGSAWSESRVASLRDELQSAQTARRELEERLRSRQAEERDVSRRARVERAGAAREDAAEKVATSPTGAGDATAGAEAEVAVDVGARRARVAELRAARPVWFERGDGEAALAALRELAAMDPEGREAAMELALAINADVSGEGELRLSDVAFYSGLSDPGIVGLMDWALTRSETPSDFRVMAAYSLPWAHGPARALEQFSQALLTEKEPDVQRALVANLGRLRDPAAERLLGAILGDENRDAKLRAQVAAELALTEDEGILRALEIAAADDDQAEVRDAARAALVARDPPATGYLVTGTLPESQAAAAGLRPGDVLVSYDGQATADVAALRAAAGAAEGRESVPVVVVRDGEEVTLVVRPGRLGIYGRAVEAKR